MPTNIPRRGLEKVGSKDRRRRRKHVINRDGNVCWICKDKIDMSLGPRDPMSFSLDHVVPWCDGGSNRVTNLKPAHRLCNNDRYLQSKKKDMDG